jgi:hypothetical protein
VETADGFIWKKKIPAITNARIQKDPAFIKVKDNIAEFGNAGKAVQLVRQGFEDQLTFAKDRRLTSRLQTEMLKVVKSDTANLRGKRVAQTGDFSTLENFQLNGTASLHRSMPVEIAATFDRPTGNVSVTVPSMVPAQILARATNVTHFRLVCAAAEFDFNNAITKKVSTVSPLMPIDNTATAPVVLNTAVTAASVLPVLIAAGIQYVEVVNGVEYPEKNGEFNALSIVKTDKP